MYFPWRIFFFGIFCGWLTLGLAQIISPFSSVSLYHKAIVGCEEKLPRDQHCKVIGILILKEMK